MMTDEDLFVAILTDVLTDFVLHDRPDSDGKIIQWEISDVQQMEIVNEHRIDADKDQ